MVFNEDRIAIGAVSVLTRIWRSPDRDLAFHATSKSGESIPTASAGDVRQT